MKKIFAVILSVVLTAILLSACGIKSARKSYNETLSDGSFRIILGETGYSLLLDSAFTKIDFFNIDGVPKKNRPIAVYSKNSSFLIVCTGKTEKSLKREAEALYDDVVKNQERFFAITKASDISYLSPDGYECATFNVDITWDDKSLKNLNITFLKNKGNYALICYLIPQNNNEAFIERTRILSENIVADK